jgi:hypothetical protein
MLGGALLEWSMLPADDDDLRAGVDVVDSAVVVPIAMPIVESSECVLLREMFWHRLLKSSDRCEVRREASSTADEDNALRTGNARRQRRRIVRCMLSVRAGLSAAGHSL